MSFLRSTSFSKMLSEAQNCKYKVNILRIGQILTIHAFSVAIFSTIFHPANPNFGLRPKFGDKIVFGLSEKTERKTNPKGDVTHWAYKQKPSIPWRMRLSQLKKAYLCPLLASDIFTNNVGQTDLVFGMRSLFISRSVHARLQVSVCSGYDLFHPD